MAEAIYRREVQPYLKRLDARLDAIAASAHARGEAMMARMDRMRVIWIFMDVLMGVALMWLVVHASRTERRKNREIAHREKLFNLLASTIDEVFFIFDREGECEYVSSNSGRVVGVPPEALLADCGKLLSFLGPDGWKPSSATSACATPWSGTCPRRGRSAASGCGSIPSWKRVPWSAVLPCWSIRPPSLHSGRP